MPYREDGTGWQRTDTSHDAMPEPTKAATIRKQVLELLDREYPEGLDSEQIADRLRIPYASVQPRTAELRNAGLIEDSQDRHMSRSRKRIIVWRAVVQPQREMDL